MLLEVLPPDGRRADIFAVGRAGELRSSRWKSSIEDWRVDGKWPDYLGWLRSTVCRRADRLSASAHSRRGRLIVADPMAARSCANRPDDRWPQRDA